MQRSVFFCCVVFLFLSCQQSKIELVKISENPMQWHKVILTFDGPESSEKGIPNPYTDYRYDLYLTGPSLQTFKVPGFFAADGKASETSAEDGNKWSAIFTPDEVGTWKYMVDFVRGPMIAAGFDEGETAGYADNFTGKFEVVETDKKSTSRDFRGKGKLEYVGEHFLQFKGTKDYFLKGGANSPEVFLEYSDFDNTPTERSYYQHVNEWNQGDPTWKNEKGKGIIGMVNYLANLDNNVFYFLTMNTEGDGKNTWPWIAKDNIWNYDCSKLEQWDKVFSHMDSVGIMINFVLTETENESLFEWYENQSTGGFADSRKIYYREMIARFGYHLAITWNIGEENGWADNTGDDGVKKANTDFQRKQFADYIQKLTYYNDHVVVHNGPSNDYHILDDESGDNILGYKSFSGPSLQGEYLADSIYHDVYKYRTLSNESGHPWVVTMDEAYIDDPTGELEIWRKENVWATFMAGGAGIELYIGGGKDVHEQDLHPYEEYYKTTAIALNFFKNHVPFWQLDPSPDFIENAWTLKNEGTYYLIYFKEAANAKISLPQGDYSLEWFDPVANTFIEGSIKQVSGDIDFDIGSVPLPEGQDRLAILKIM